MRLDDWAKTYYAVLQSAKEFPSSSHSSATMKLAFSHCAGITIGFCQCNYGILAIHSGFMFQEARNEGGGYCNKSLTFEIVHFWEWSVCNMLHIVYGKLYTNAFFLWIQRYPWFWAAITSLHCILMTEERIWLPEEFIRSERNWVK